MEKLPQHIIELLALYAEGQSLSPRDLEELEKWSAKTQFNAELISSLQDRDFVRAALEQRVLAETFQKAGWITIADHIHSTQSNPASVQRVHLLKTRWFRWASAAAILIFFGIGAYLYTTQKVKPVSEKIMVAADVAAPDETLATITLSNGKKVTLDSLSNGLLAQEGSVQIKKLANGQIIYKGGGKGKMLYNTIAVPRGSKIASLTLSDGTIVYLNSESSLTYPVAFTETERKVEIIGEAYFEVAKDAKRKFIVKSGSVTTEVLGTHFNINSYQEENSVKVTLLEGKVKSIRGRSEILLKPGNQVSFTNSSMKLDESANIEQVMAWKNGIFNFSNTSFENAMRQVSRWYDVKVVYADKIPVISFGGKIPKSISLSEMLEALQAVGVKYKIDGKILTILP